MTATTAAAAPVEDLAAPGVEPVEPVEGVEQDLLVEDVSIDGMCGVY